MLDLVYFLFISLLSLLTSYSLIILEMNVIQITNYSLSRSNITVHCITEIGQFWAQDVQIILLKGKGSVCFASMDFMLGVKHLFYGTFGIFTCTTPSLHY